MTIAARSRPADPGRCAFTRAPARVTMSPSTPGSVRGSARDLTTDPDSGPAPPRFRVLDPGRAGAGAGRRPGRGGAAPAHADHFRARCSAAPAAGPVPLLSGAV